MMRNRSERTERQRKERKEQDNGGEGALSVAVRFVVYKCICVA